ncbi:ParB/RepB/Spo0J family partition protein [Candidatus Nomurabacteria bacterium]|nr:ParB/RepB/Spo0J family partition protein [Candidatus Nomurabacteria bacterium]
MALGRGLGSLIPDKNQNTNNSNSSTVIKDEDRIQHLDPEKIKVNPWQPRSNFDREKLEELTESIKQHGIIQPLVVTKEYDGYQLIAGERRLRAAKNLGLKEVPVIVREATDKDKLELSIIENVQRHNLNPLEEAESYQRLLEEFGLSREDIAKQVSKSPSGISNYLRLLKLPIVIKEAILNNQISFSHAKVILSVTDKLEQIKIFKKIIKNDLTVRELENLSKKTTEKIKERQPQDPIVTSWEDKLSKNLGSKVKIEKKGEKGMIKINFFSHEELKNLLDKLEE